jgi:rubrerythrin
MVAAEYEAVQMYVQLAESTDNKFAMAVLKDIADEERVHAGEFLKLLHYLAPEETELYEKGAKEVDGILSEVQKK